MKPSTATFIPYNLRPAKQAERRILLDFLQSASEVGLPVSNCRYVGMGGTMFYDFHLMHRFLGINRMVSLERDSDIHPRCKFNCPFDFINVENETAATFLARDKNNVPTIYWFDYDDGFRTRHYRRHYFFRDASEGWRVCICHCICRSSRRSPESNQGTATRIFSAKYGRFRRWPHC